MLAFYASIKKTSKLDILIMKDTDLNWKMSLADQTSTVLWDILEAERWKQCSNWLTLVHKHFTVNYHKWPCVLLYYIRALLLPATALEDKKETTERHKATQNAHTYSQNGSND